MRNTPHTEEETKNNQPPKSLCRTSLARSAQISESFKSNRITPINNSEFIDKISEDSISSDGSDDMITESNFQKQTSKTASPHISSLKRNQNNANLPSSNFLQHISHSPNLTSYASLKRNNEISKPILEQIDFPINQKLILVPKDNKNDEEKNNSESNNESISNDYDSDSFDDGLVRTQVSKVDPIQTDENFWEQDPQNNNNENDSNTDQIDTEDNDVDKIETEMPPEYDKNYSSDAIEEGSQNFSNPNFGQNSLLQSDNISEDESDDQFDEAAEEIDGTVQSQFFKQQKVVFEFIDEETNELDKWNFEYLRVIYAKTIDSEIDELKEDSYRILVRKNDTQHIKKQGDNFVMHVPYFIYAYLEKIYIIAPKVSDKL